MVPSSIHEPRAVISLLDYLMDRVLYVRTVFCSSVILILPGILFYLIVIIIIIIIVIVIVIVVVIVVIIIVSIIIIIIIIIITIGDN